MSVAFREYEPRDWAPLVDMYTSFEPKGVYMGLPPLRLDLIMDWLQGLLGDEKNTHFILWTGMHVIAHAALVYYPNLPASREIIVFVHQAHQGCGWGRTIFLGVLNWAAAQQDVDDVWLFVDWHNVAARELYTSTGFSGRPHGIRDSETLMRRRLRG